MYSSVVIDFISINNASKYFTIIFYIPIVDHVGNFLLLILYSNY